MLGFLGMRRKCLIATTTRMIIIHTYRGVCAEGMSTVKAAVKRLMTKASKRWPCDFVCDNIIPISGCAIVCFLVCIWSFSHYVCSAHHVRFKAAERTTLVISPDNTRKLTGVRVVIQGDMTGTGTIESPMGPLRLPRDLNKDIVFDLYEGAIVLNYTPDDMKTSGDLVVRWEFIYYP